jgi:hypothetical protein
MANKYRGEVDVQIGEKTFVCRPTFEAMAEFEDVAGASAYALLQAAAHGTPPKARQMVAVFHACIKAAWKDADGPCPLFAALGNQMQRHGSMRLFPDYVRVLTHAVSSDADLAKQEAEKDEGKAPDEGGPPQK